ncbi:unnamed protein product [Lathyrus sativus]|nr:unnamed protein product [Lathyrus sativus]
MATSFWPLNMQGSKSKEVTSNGRWSELRGLVCGSYVQRFNGDSVMDDACIEFVQMKSRRTAMATAFTSWLKVNQTRHGGGNRHSKA